MSDRVARRSAKQDEMFEARAATEIHAPRQLVWDLIKPAENAPILEPTITRAFKAEGTPDGAGEIQVYIHTINGKEHVTAVEITDEAPAEYAIIRSIGGGEATPTIGYFLTDTTAGTNLEIRHRIIMPRRGGAYARNLLANYEDSAHAMLRRVKALAEHRWDSRSPGLRAWNGEPDQPA